MEDFPVCRDLADKDDDFELVNHVQSKLDSLIPLSS